MRVVARFPVLTVLLIAALCGCSKDAPVNASRNEASKSLLIITLDTTRADAMGFLGSSESVTPNLDALAERGFVATNARTVTPLTMPAHASIMTGLYPPRHTVRDNNIEPLPPSAETLAERARERGVETAAFVASVAVDRSFGFDQGFDTYDQPARTLRQIGTHATERPAEAVTAAWQTWMSARTPGEPFACWLHFFDPHAPYQPSAEFAGRSSSPYLDEIARMDASLGGVFELLRERGELDQTLVIVVGDHGEGLGQDGEATHGLLIQDSTMRVPYIVAFPDGAHAGERSDTAVSVVDVFPTALAALGWGEPGDVDGRDLFGAPPSEEHGVYFESWYGNLSYGLAPLLGWADADGVYHWSGRERMYLDDWADGPGMPPETERARLVRRRLGDVLNRSRLTAGAPADASGLDSLRGLGYLSMPRATSAWPDPFTLSDLGDPYDNLLVHHETHAAMAAIASGQVDEGIAGLRKLLEVSPNSAIALERLSQALVDQERFKEALPLLQRLVKSGPAWAPVQYNLGVAYFQTGSADLGRVHLERAVALDPGHVQSLYALVQIADQADEKSAADGYRELLRRAGVK